MKLLFVGKTTFEYNRDLILLNGLRRRKDVDIELFEIKNRGWSTFKKIRKISKEVDFVIVPTFRHKDVGFIKLASNAPVVFDPLISKYMTRVLDYGVKWKGPHKLLVDWLAFSWPDILIWDTKSHQEYLVNKFRLKKPMTHLYIGVDTTLFYPIQKKDETNLIVGFYGSFNPLQGIDKIIRAAHILKSESNIVFQIIGSGSTFKSVKKLASELETTNVEFLGNVPYKDLNKAINEFDICLGVFGDSVKTDVVIPNKIYHYAAADKCIITKNTKAIREIFSDQQNIILTQNTPKDIANSILKLSQQKLERKSLGKKAGELMRLHYNQDEIAKRFVEFLKSCSQG